MMLKPSFREMVEKGGKPEEIAQRNSMLIIVIQLVNAVVDEIFKLIQHRQSSIKTVRLRFLDL